jgi:hypothetical protein
MINPYRSPLRLPKRSDLQFYNLPDGYKVFRIDGEALAP